MNIVPSRVARFLVVAVLVAVAAGCGPSASVCSSSPCGSGKPVELCEDTDGNTAYTFGGMTCACNAHDPASCDACASRVDAYCYPTPAP